MKPDLSKNAISTVHANQVAIQFISRVLRTSLRRVTISGQVRRHLTDCHMPQGVSLDYKKMEISIDWRDFFAAFYGKLYLFQNLSKSGRYPLEPIWDQWESTNSRQDAGRDRIYQALKLAERVVDVEHDFGGRKEHEYLQKMSILRDFNGEDEFSDDNSDVILDHSEEESVSSDEVGW